MPGGGGGMLHGGVYFSCHLKSWTTIITIISILSFNESINVMNWIMYAYLRVFGLYDEE